MSDRLGISFDLCPRLKTLPSDIGVKCLFDIKARFRFLCISPASKKRTHETCWEGNVGSDLSVDFDGALHNNFRDLLFVQSILQFVSQHNN